MAATVVAAGLSVVGSSPASASTILTAHQFGPRPNATRIDFPVGDHIDATADVATGNLLLTTTDLTLPGIQKNLQLGLDFNSVALWVIPPQPVGSPGPGWQMRIGQDTQLIENSDNSVLYMAPEGRQGLFQPAAGSSYTAPAGFKDDLVKTGSTGWTLTDHDSNDVSTFNASGMLTKITDRNGQVTSFTYTSGKLSQISSDAGGPGASTATVSFNPMNGLVSGLSQTGDAGIGTRSVSYTYSGTKLVKLTDTAGRDTIFAYNSVGDLTKLTNTGGEVTDFTYDSPTHHVTSVTRENPGGTDATTRFTYTTSVTKVAGPNTDQSMPVNSVPHTTYNYTGNYLPNNVVDSLGNTRLASYTPFSDVASTTSGTGGQTTASYPTGTNGGESLTQVTAATGATQKFGYTNTGASTFLPSGSTDTQSNTSAYTYDGAGNQLTNKNNTTTAQASVAYNTSGSNTDGTLKTSTDPKGNVTTFTDNTATHQLSGVSPPSGSGLGAISITYDGYGRKLTVQDGNGVTTTYGYDNLDRTTSITYSDGTPTVTYGYDTAGNIHTRTDGTGTVTYGYDPLNRLTSRTATTGGGTETYGYDPAGNRTSLTDGRGTTTSTYDAANELTSMNTAEGQLINFGYNGNGKRTDTWWATNSGNTTWAAHTVTSYDIAGRISETKTIAKSSAPTTVFDTSYCYSPHVSGQPCPTTSVSTDTGLVQWQKDNTSGQISTFSYGAANRLTAATNFNGHDYGYSYDSNGNRTTVTVDGTTTQNLGTFNSGNHPSAAGYTYDSDGQLTHDPTAGTLTYDGAGQMTAQSGTLNSTYSYAGPDQRELIHQVVPGGATVDYTYGPTAPDGNPELEQLTKGGSTNYFDYDNTGTPLAMYVPGGGNHYIVPDGLGSTVALVGSGNTITATYTYDPYGVLTASTNPPGGAAAGLNPIRYTAGLVDRGTNWLKNGLRWYDPGTGRWTQQDPIAELLNPQNANPYGYAAGAPTTYVDPTGQLTADQLVDFYLIFGGAGLAGEAGNGILEITSSEIAGEALATAGIIGASVAVLGGLAIVGIGICLLVC